MTSAPLTPGSLAGRQIGGYQVIALVGAGGMGEVYRARDLRLGRDVALKVLRKERAGDPAQQTRFLREARAAGSLNHPNILAVFDVGVEDAVPFIVAEFIEGQSLRHEIERSRLPTQVLLNIATQIADGLTVAHEAGIVHRDLKPENVMVTEDGRAKILDFGLAKVATGRTGTNGSALPETETEAGLIQGTAPYMSPEQARGAPADFRSDQFALGLILYEMTTGRQAFRRETAVQTLSAIITDVPPSIASLNPHAPAALRWLIGRCLAKDPGHRYAATRDLAQDLRTLRDHLPELAIGRVLTRPKSAWLFMAGICLILVGFGLGLTWSHFSSASLSDRSMIPAPDGAAFSDSSAFMAVSPDGKRIAFIASSPQGNNMLWIRELDRTEPRLLPGTDGVGQPFWSSNSNSLAFSTISGARIGKRIDVSTGRMQWLAESVGSGTWGHDDTIIVPSEQRGGELYRVSLVDSSVTQVTTLETSQGEYLHMWPSLLPDNRHFLFLAASHKPEYDSILYIGSLDSPVRIRLFQTGSHAVYAPPGYLIYMQENTLVAQAFDAQNLRITGVPVAIANGVERTSGSKSRRGAFSVSQTGGILAYRQVADTQLIWFNRSGVQLEPIAPPAPYGNPALSPDQRQVAVNRLDPATGVADIYTINVTQSAASRVTRDPAEDAVPLWTPDGRAILFRSSRYGPPGAPAGPAFYDKSLSTADPDRLVLNSVGPFGIPLGWAPDGQTLLYETSGRFTFMDVWTLRAGERKPVSFLSTEANERQAQLSSDGHWIAYVSDESKRNEVYVRAFPSGEGKIQISTGGGVEPQWKGDGTELFYLAPDRVLMSVTMQLGSTAEHGTPQVLFSTRLSPLSNPAYTRNQYLVTRDGQRFLLNQPATTTSTPITVVRNWMALLKK